MEKIKFMLEDVDDVLEEYMVALEKLGERKTAEYEGEILTVKNYRIVVPKLESSFRMALWHNKAEAVQEVVWVRYPENELDIDAWEQFAPYGLYDFCDDLYEDSGMDYDADELDDMECFLVADEM